ncbi:hypothetical protein SPRG_21839 [Saprolegnia parasitica CBS 223.65]|uniref:Insertion element IS150 protein InsJ-like helix-turn-helix domain-containing protein n=1 Tax=Saprolegnia parasitica (strain CBS 223.65) TaxID=695850 RepID=A0A067BG16_SAPPC|nr:hypothetical protein SPRG_21839 [Saprolegnia parasitica CBS 223.65]KDO17098.1 hypothetical protein SPRG_21839 [Saprolegnia parasitica CBS 223.65]|eukprot:XP_012212195.1 hypothetical protein SPRG_21839 [Saprolegnia parasitica CBS 223.65]
MRGPEHSEQMRRAVISKAADGKTQRQISKELEIPASSVGNIIRHFKAWHTLAPAPRSGRPRKTSLRTDRVLTRNVLNRQESALELRRELEETTGIRLSASTICRRMHAVGLHYGKKPTRLNSGKSKKI